MLVRLSGVKGFSIGRVGSSNWMWPVVLQPASWLAICLIGALATIGGLLTEWQRRVTLVALVEKAPAGTVIIQADSRGGPAMKVYVGHGSPHGDEPTTVSVRLHEIGGDV